MEFNHWLSQQFLSVPFSSGQGMIPVFGRSALRGCPLLSVPFSSGQGMILMFQTQWLRNPAAFSPLFIGARNDTASWNYTDMEDATFQSPFHRGKE